MPDWDDSEEVAEQAGLVYVSDEQPGIVRRGAGTGWYFVYPDGSRVRGAAVLRRIERLAIPPAWKGVWICRRPNGHLQAVGEDERGRKQYIYHPAWREVRETNKFARLAEFGRALPSIREQVRRDLRKRGLPKEKVLAAIIALLERTQIRIGNEQYARENRSYGLTTLKGRHVKVRGAKLVFKFRGKSGLEHEIDLHHKKLAEVVKDLQDLPGQDLFQYEDEDGGRGSVSSTDVNGYLHVITGADFTAKDFRTWQASLVAGCGLHRCGPRETDKECREAVREVLEEVAKELGNTPAVCRQAYVYPRLLEVYEKEKSLKGWDAFSERALARCEGLGQDEARLVCFIEQG